MRFRFTNMPFVAAILAGIVLPSVPRVWAQTIQAEATFENIGLNVDFASPPAPDLRIGLELREADQKPFRPVHPLLRLSPTRFAGSVFNLKAGTRYELRLDYAGADSNQSCTVVTRAERFPAPDGPTLHVDPARGDDHNDGRTAAQAFQSLRRALQELRPGVTVLLHGGRYHEGDLTVSQSGTATEPIVIRNAPGEQPVIDGTSPDFVPAWTLSDAAYGVYRAPCAAQPATAYLDGGQLFRYTDYESLRAGRWNQPSGFVVDGEFFYLRLPDHGNPAGHVVTIPAASVGLTLSAGVAFVQLVGLEFAHIGFRDDHCGLDLSGARSNLIDHCQFRQVGPGIALRHGASDNVIQHSFFTEAPLASWSWTAVKQGNDSYEQGGVAVIAGAEAAVGNVVRDNVFSNLFDGASLYAEDARAPTRNMDVYDNVFVDCADDAMEADGYGTNVRIYRNRMEDVRSCVSVAPSTPGPTYIMRNVLGPSPARGRDGRIPIKFNCAVRTVTQGVYLYHNTMFSNVPGQAAFVLYVSGNRWTNVVSRNNLYVGTEYGFYGKAMEGAMDFDYDDCYGGGAMPFGWWRGELCATFRAFQQASRQERHGWSLSPGWINPRGRDFRLRAGSPMIDRGERVPGVNDDFAGAAPDIGAFEYTPPGGRPALAPLRMLP